MKKQRSLKSSCLGDERESYASQLCTRSFLRASPGSEHTLTTLTGSGLSSFSMLSEDSGVVALSTLSEASASSLSGVDGSSIVVKAYIQDEKYKLVEKIVIQYKPSVNFDHLSVP